MLVYTPLINARVIPIPSPVNYNAINRKIANKRGRKVDGMMLSTE